MTKKKSKTSKVVKKAVSVDEKKEKRAGALSSGLRRGIGDNSYRTLKSRPLRSLWNAILGSKGFGKGLIYEFFGESEVGKTGTLMMLGGEFQNQGETYGHVDAEHAMNKEFARRQLGVDVDEVLVSEDPIRSGEHAFEVALAMLDGGADILVIDSIAAMRPEESMTGDKDRIGAHALLMSKQMPRLAEAAKRAEATVLTVNQTRKNIGVLFGDPTTTTGGQAPAFYASVRIRVSKVKVIKGSNGEELGYIVKYRTTKNRTGFKRGEFQVVMDRGFIPNLAATAVLWAKDKTFDRLGLIDREARTIAGQPISGAINVDKNLETAISGKEHLVFEAVDDFFTEGEKGQVLDAESNDDDAGSAEVEAQV